MDKKTAKKLIGIFKHCIDAMSFTHKTRHHRNIIKKRMINTGEKYKIPVRFSKI